MRVVQWSRRRRMSWWQRAYSGGSVDIAGRRAGRRGCRWWPVGGGGAGLLVVRGFLPKHRRPGAARVGVAVVVGGGLLVLGVAAVANRLCRWCVSWISVVASWSEEYWQNTSRGGAASLLWSCRLLVSECIRRCRRWRRILPSGREIQACRWRRWRGGRACRCCGRPAAVWSGCG